MISDPAPPPMNADGPTAAAAPAEPSISPSPSVPAKPAAPAPIHAKMRWYYRFCQWGCRLIFLLFFRGRAYHAYRVPREGGVLLACNHQSFLDPVIAAYALPRECHFMGRDTLFENPWFAKLIESLNCYPIKRGAADTRAIKESLRRLKGGAALVAFPEGTRTTDGRLGTLLPGVILIARKARVPIVPTYIAGAYQAFPRSAKLPRRKPISVAYGQPISADALASMSDEQCMAAVRDELLRLEARYAPLVADS